MPSRAFQSTCLALAAFVAGCGGAQPERTVSDAERPRPLETRAPHACDTARVTGARVPDVKGARSELDAAVRSATKAGHRFTVRLRITGGRLRLPSSRIEGRRLPGNASSARVSWPPSSLRIVDDRLYLRLHADGEGWRDVGSASGVSLDVGRELLAHPFLLAPTHAWRSASSVGVRLVAPTQRLRAYATGQRRGPVTELLRNARRLEITAVVIEGRLAADTFLLETVAPAGLPFLRRGAQVTIAGSTAYCPLHPTDRAQISAPRVAA